MWSPVFCDCVCFWWLGVGGLTSFFLCKIIVPSELAEKPAPHSTPHAPLFPFLLFDLSCSLSLTFSTPAPSHLRTFTLSHRPPPLLEGPPFFFPFFHPLHPQNHSFPRSHPFLTPVAPTTSSAFVQS
ncbi:hypothetical protein BZA05DRAFT_259788 [Tricharina praecox]|uniref:uncharacterized protein n=1 Tax=Tricharina praecox TaxID=43433 RepID=UPI00221E9881|nr:uncharacterized protein BZA05DRAFT_259788 [Tricharina praecox]KAI5854186.1 hypothetical protein BZA05DRAFT_259788 [Tricharina praecox]